MNEPKRRGRPRKDTHDGYLEENYIQTDDESEPKEVTDYIKEESVKSDIEEESSLNNLSSVDSIAEEIISKEEPNIPEIDTQDNAFSEKQPELTTKNTIPEGYSDIGSAPRNGLPIVVSDETGANVVAVYWKKTRAFANTKHKWIDTGFWAGELSGQKINFIPSYWKMRDRRR